MRKYVSLTDKPIIHDAIVSVGISGGFLTTVAKALRSNGIAWPNLQGDSPEAKAIDEDCTAILTQILKGLL